jgi:predicted O-methyltransferase YrrM
MSLEQWTEVDRYVTDLLSRQDAVLDGVLKASAAAELPGIHVSAPQGKLLMLLAMAQGARNILELGTLGGYSSIWLARALPTGGRLVTLEADPKHVEVARANFKRAGMDGIIELRVGPALDTLPLLAAEGRGPFDLTFIDADKPGTPDYFAWAVKLSRKGSVIIADNVVREGALADPASDDPRVRAMRRFHEVVAAEPRVSATTIQTVGSKGYDGFTLAVVIGDTP